MYLKFIFSELYHNQLNRHSEKKHDWKIVKTHCESFTKEYDFLFSVMILEIERVMDKPFIEEIIPIYLVGWEGPSFSNPLTLNAKKDKLLMFATLCHELLHRMYPGEGPSFELEEKINNKVKIILDNIKIKADEQIEVMRQRARERYKIITA